MLLGTSKPIDRLLTPDLYIFEDILQNYNLKVFQIFYKPLNEYIYRVFLNI